MYVYDSEFCPHWSVVVGTNQLLTRTDHMVSKCVITGHMDHVPNVQNHVTFRTHFNGSILSSLLLYTLGHG